MTSCFPSGEKLASLVWSKLRLPTYNLLLPSVLPLAAAKSNSSTSVVFNVPKEKLAAASSGADFADHRQIPGWSSLPGSVPCLALLENQRVALAAIDTQLARGDLDPVLVASAHSSTCVVRERPRASPETQIATSLELALCFATQQRDSCEKFEFVSLCEASTLLSSDRFCRIDRMGWLLEQHEGSCRDAGVEPDAFH